MLKEEEETKIDLDIIEEWIHWDEQNDTTLYSVEAISHLKKVKNKRLVSGLLNIFLFGMVKEKTEVLKLDDKLTLTAENVVIIMEELGINETSIEDMIYYRSMRKKNEPKGSLDLVKDFYNILVNIIDTSTDDSGGSDLMDHQRKNRELMKKIDLSTYSIDDIKRTITIFESIEEYLICEYLNDYLKK